MRKGWPLNCALAAESGLEAGGTATLETGLVVASCGTRPALGALELRAEALGDGTGSASGPGALLVTEEGRLGCSSAIEGAAFDVAVAGSAAGRASRVLTNQPTAPNEANAVAPMSQARPRGVVRES